MDQFQLMLKNGTCITIYRSICSALDSNMFIIMKEGIALIVDSNEEEELLSLFEDNHISKVFILLTHEHYDHTSGVCWLQEKFDATIICNRTCAERICEARRNIPKLVSFVLANKDKEDGGHRYQDFKKTYKPYTLYADIIYDAPCEFELMGMKIQATQTPGHSPGSWCLVVDDSFVITGDSLIQNTPVLERFKESSPEDFRNITLPYLKGLDDTLYVLPGHGDPFLLKDNGIINKY